MPVVPIVPIRPLAIDLLARAARCDHCANCANSVCCHRCGRCARCANSANCANSVCRRRFGRCVRCANSANCANSARWGSIARPIARSLGRSLGPLSGLPALSLFSPPSRTQKINFRTLQFLNPSIARSKSRRFFLGLRSARSIFHIGGCLRGLRSLTDLRMILTPGRWNSSKRIHEGK